MKTKLLSCGIMVCLAAGANPALGADAAPAPTTSTTAPAATVPARGRGGRGNNTPASVAELAEIAKLAELPLYTPDAGDGDYSTGPTFADAPELTARADVPKGKVVKFTMDSADSKFYPGISRTAPGAVVPYKREVTVYIPSQYVPGTPAPVIVSADAYRPQLPTILDNLIADHRLPVMLAVMIANGGGDGQGSERGLEYDTVSGKYAEFVEAEVLPRIEKDCGVTFTKNPEGRMTLGGSSGGAVAFTMAWFHPELYHRVLVYSGTFVNQQSPLNPESPHGAWEYHAHLIPENPAKPLRVWMEVGENDNGAKSAESTFHNWVIANQRMAAVLKAKGYHYQLVYAKGAGHTDRKAIAQTLPQALEWVWKGYPLEPAKDAKAAPASKPAS